MIGPPGGIPAAARTLYRRGLEVDAFCELAARLEVKHALGLHADLVARLGVARRPRRALPRREITEPAKFGTLAGLKVFPNARQEEVNAFLDILRSEIRKVP
ncbi:MAG TPA: hypothetical protein VN667_21160 [Burkholderiales bacterium]|nr:hypothetical protein [Burkholderiales bacterium]